MEEILDELLEEFANKVAEAIAEKAGSEPKIVALHLGKYSYGSGLRVEHECGVSVDLSYSHLYDFEEED